MNIWSGSDVKFAAALTNPTSVSKRKGKIVNDYPVTVDGVTYLDAESAYQKLKWAGSAGQRFEVMTRIITEKLKQHPRLKEMITVRGGVAFLETCTHCVTRKGSVWEGEGRKSKFIVCLIDAYESL
jgi:phage pi2 protein 07